MEALYWVWLQQVLGYGSAVGDLILQQGLSPKDLYHASAAELEEEGTLPEGLIRKLKGTSLSQAEKILRHCEALHIWLMTPEDEDYPPRLRQIYQVPLVLYGVGQRSFLSKELLITMVGARKATKLGGQSAYDLAQDLVQYGFGVVSGLAMGIDSCAHQGALDQGGLTIGVTGCGLTVDYPKGNLELRRRIGKKGVIVGEYPPDYGVHPSNFPVRNRILSGLSLGTVVVEASAKSGTLITADLALQQGRDVFALPTDLYNHNGAGNLKLIGQGAIPVLSSQTIAEEYSTLYGDKLNSHIQSRVQLRRQEASETPVLDAVVARQEPPPAPKEPKAEAAEVKPLPEEAPADLEPQAQSLWKALGKEPRRVEELAADCGLELPQTLQLLTELELEGLCKAYPGKRFSR